MEGQRRAQKPSGPFELAASGHQGPEASGAREAGAGGAGAVCSRLLEAGLPCKGDQGWKEGGPWGCCPKTSPVEGFPPMVRRGVMLEASHRRGGPGQVLASSASSVGTTPGQQHPAVASTPLGRMRVLREVSALGWFVTPQCGTDRQPLSPFLWSTPPSGLAPLPIPPSSVIACLIVCLPPQSAPSMRQGRGLSPSGPGYFRHLISTGCMD